MLDTSKDFLNIAIAISVLGLAVFLSLSIYYLGMILREVFKIAKEMRDRLAKIDELVKSLKEKIEHSTSYLLLIGEGIKKLVEVIKDRTAKKDKEDEEVRSKN